MNLAFAINQNYIGQFKVTLRSVVETNPGAHDLYVLHSDLTAEDTDALAEYAHRLNTKISFYRIDPSIFHGLAKMSYDKSYTAYNKVLLLYITDCLDRLLFLDCDIIVRGDLTPLYELPTETLLACAKDIRINNKHKEHIRKIVGQDAIYFNSGVILFNFEHRNEIVQKEAISQYLAEHGNDIRWHDQDILNHFYAKHYTLLDGKYNYLTTYSSFSDFFLRRGERRAIIVHYANWKPWNDNYIGKYYRLYKKYYRLCSDEKEVNFLKKRSLRACVKQFTKYLLRRQK